MAPRLIDFGVRIILSVGVAARIGKNCSIVIERGKIEPPSDQEYRKESREGSKMSKLPRLYGGCLYFRKLSYFVALPIGLIPYFGTFLSPTLQPPSSNWIYYWRSWSSEASRSTPCH